MSEVIPSQSIPFGNTSAIGVIDISQYMYTVARQPINFTKNSPQFSGATLLVINNSDSGIVVTWGRSGVAMHIAPGGNPMLPIPVSETVLKWAVEYQNTFQSFPAEVISCTFYYPYENGNQLAQGNSLYPNPPASSITPGQLPVGVNPSSPLDLISPVSTTVTPAWKIACIDSMKDSRDTSAPANNLSYVTILQGCQLAASLGVTHITVDVFYDYPAYFALWVKAVRAVGKKIWFRAHWNNWEGNNGQPANMTPAQNITATTAFIAANPTLFKAGDIFDACAESEGSPYWVNTYGSGYTSGAPNVATDAWNQFLLDMFSAVNTQMAASGIPVDQTGATGVITGLMSHNSFFANHPTCWYDTTIATMGNWLAYDSYPEGSNTDPLTCATLRVDEINSIIVERQNTILLVIGEIGYSNNQIVTDANQLAVLQAECLGIGTQPGIIDATQIVGMNYWVGQGTETSGGHTHIFDGQRGAWFPRPAATFLATFFQTQLGTNGFLIGNIYPGQLQAGTLPPEIDVTQADTNAVYDGTVLEFGRNWIGTVDPRTLANVPPVNDGDVWFNPNPSGGTLNNTVGRTTTPNIGVNHYQGLNNQFWYSWLASLSGTLQSISFYFDGEGGNVATFWGVLWSNAGVLIASTNSGAFSGGSFSVGGQHWHTLTFASPPTITAGTTYKIGVENDHTKLVDWSTWKSGSTPSPFSSFGYAENSGAHPGNIGGAETPGYNGPAGVYFVVQSGTVTAKISVSRVGVWVQII